jgi:hypothetical protein
VVAAQGVKKALARIGFAMQSNGMESNWAAEHLQVIRTLMERSALYRRALAPIMIFNGAVGLAAAALGWGLRIGSPRGFILFWTGVGVVAVAGSFLLVRRQAIKDAEPIWSPPTRRITQAFMPPLAAGLMIGTAAWMKAGSAPGNVSDLSGVMWLPLIWVVLYGCAFHAAGFFMPRGMKVFGWGFIVGGCGLLAAGMPGWAAPLGYAHGIMGLFFGSLHLAYGVYLRSTERRGNEA